MNSTERRQYDRDRYARRRKAGLCLNCPNRVRVRGQSRCRQCLDRNNREVANRKAARQCAQCRKPHSGTTTLCDSCRNQTRHLRHSLRESRKTEGLCTTCGGFKVNPTLAECGKCRAAKRRINLRWRKRAAKSGTLIPVLSLKRPTGGDSGSRGGESGLNVNSVGVRPSKPNLIKKIPLQLEYIILNAIEAFDDFSCGARW